MIFKESSVFNPDAMSQFLVLYMAAAARLFIRDNLSVRGDTWPTLRSAVQ